MQVRISRRHVSRLRVSPLRHSGWTICAVGAAGDLEHHTLPRHFSMALTPLVEPNAYHGRLLTLVVSVLRQGALHAR